jgi:hypothetical protein
MEIASDSLAIHVSCSVGVKYQWRATLSNLCSLKQESIHTVVIEIRVKLVVEKFWTEVATLRPKITTVLEHVMPR